MLGDGELGRPPRTPELDATYSRSDRTVFARALICESWAAAREPRKKMPNGTTRPRPACIPGCSSEFASRASMTPAWRAREVTGDTRHTAALPSRVKSADTYADLQLALPSVKRTANSRCYGFSRVQCRIGNNTCADRRANSRFASRSVLASLAGNVDPRGERRYCDRQARQRLDHPSAGERNGKESVLPSGSSRNGV